MAPSLFVTEKFSRIGRHVNGWPVPETTTKTVL